MRGGLLSVLCLIAWTGGAWADLTVETQKGVDVEGILADAQAAVPEVGGLVVNATLRPGTTLVTFQRRSGDFSAAEQTALVQAVGRHSASTWATQRATKAAKKATDKVAAKAALRLGEPLTDAQIEALVGD